MTEPFKMELYPYWHRNTWVFDDPERGLYKEAFVLGTDEIITEALHRKGIKRRKAKRGHKLTFSTAPIPGGFTAQKLGPRTFKFEEVYEVTPEDAQVFQVHTDTDGKTIVEQAVPWWQDEVVIGNDYLCPEMDKIGWLCPALFKYFDKAPQTLYFTVEETPWRVARTHRHKRPETKLLPAAKETK